MPGATLTLALERGCVAILLLWLVWIPMPFGSVVEAARIPLIGIPLVTCILAAAIRLRCTWDRNSTAQPTRAWLIWGVGAMAFLVLGLLQLIPLPASMLHALSPESQAIWKAAAHVGSLAGSPARSMFPISVDPAATMAELFRLAALLATFCISALMIRSQERRMALASILCATAMFETMYGLHEAALQRYAIWGWVNHLIFNRVTGTFVNPNHFAHYLAIVFPMALFLIASKWHVSGDRDMPPSRRLANLLEHGIFTSGFALLAGVSCVAGILLGQSRGGLLALVTGLLFASALLPGKRLLRATLAGVAALILVGTLVMYLGPKRTVARFVPNELEQETLVGRRIGIASALGVWERFSLLGSGLGTFRNVVSMEQEQDLAKVYTHAHNDFAEIAATAGTAGFLVAFASLVAGYVALTRMTVGQESLELAWRRRAFQWAALASITIAAAHAMIDFNFFIPANPATLAAIAGAAVASVDHDRRTRR